MAGTVQVTITDERIGLVTLHPPKAGAGELLHDLIGEWDALVAQPGLKGVILRSAGRNFAQGLLDEDRFSGSDAALLSDLCTRIEDSPFPVIAAMSGLASGAGLELAMAAHYRIADHQAHVVLPGIAMGLLPNAGATQRLPRLVGVQAALEILLAGKPLAAVEADRLGLIDAAVSQDAEDAAQSFLLDLLGSGQAEPRPVSALRERFKDYAADTAAISRFRAQQAGNPVPAGARMVDCVEAAFMMPFEIGLGYERAAAEDVAASLQARAMCHIRRAQLRSMPSHSAPVHRVAIAGGGEAVAQLAVRLLDAGVAVTVAAPTEAGRNGTQEMIVRLYHLAEAEGRLTEQALARRISRLELATGVRALADAEVIFVPMPTSTEAAQRALAAVVDATSEDTALALLGQGHLIDSLAESGSVRRRVIGLSFPTDPLVARLAELTQGADTETGLIDRLHLLARRMGLSVLRRRDSQRSLCDQVASAGLHAADQMLVQGASPYQVDKALRAYGFAEGPYERIDTLGLDRAGTGPGLLGQFLISEARMGRNAGQGYYRYDGDAALPDPAVSDQLKLLSAELAITRRGFTDDEIVQRYMAAMANAGARLIEQGQATTPGDVDMAITEGYGLARWRGGPMFQADQTGLLELQRELRAWSDEDPDFWAPATLLAEMVKYGRHFSDPNWQPV